MDSFKVWLIEVGIKKALPSLARAAIAGFVGLLIAHSGELAKLGIGYDKTAGIVTIHLGALQDWLVAGGLGAITSILAIIQHHTTQAITGGTQ